MSTISLSVLDESFVAGADLSGCQYKGVQVTSDYTIKAPTAALVNAFAGVLQDKPAAAGRSGRVITLGKTKAYLGATMTIGEKVYCAASGWFSKVTSGYAPVGHITKTANSGYIGEIALTGLGAVAANSFAAGQI